MVASFNHKRIVQHIPLNKSAYSLKSGESDDEPVIQVEIVGFASTSHNWSDAQLKWLAVEVLAEIYKLWWFEIKGPPQGFKGANDGIYPYIASAASPIRFTKSQFENWGGVCGHQHAPSPDDHWDPGKLNINKLLQYTKEAVLAEAPSSTDLKALADAVARLDARVTNQEEDIRLLANLLPFSDSPYDTVVALYKQILAREPDNEGLNYWTTQISKGMPLSQVLDAFLEAKRKEGK
jgi:hypothetical protein